MTHKSLGVRGLLSLLLLQPALAAEPSEPQQDPILPRSEVAGKPVRFLSLAEALQDARQQWARSAPRSREEGEVSLNMKLLNVESAYWQLYGAYGTLYSREQGVRQSRETWNNMIEGSSVTAADLAQVRGQYELFRSQRLTAVDKLLDRERDLRALLGMPPEDDRRLVPSTAPTLE
jgi:outer membrane protein TolC